MKIIVLWYIVLALQLLDLVTTYLGIRAGAREVTPWLVKLQSIMPGKWTWLFVTKAAAICILWWMTLKWPDDMKAALVIITIIYVWVVMQNLRVIDKQRALRR